MNLNRVLIAGRISREVELKYTQSGMAVCTLGMAINEVYGKGNDRKEDTLFVDVTVWGKSAENCAEYLSKGRPVFVEGRLKQDTWQDKDTGKNRSKITVTAQSVQFLGSKQGGENKPLPDDAPGWVSGQDDDDEDDTAPF